MKITGHSFSFYLLTLYIFPMYFTISWTLYSHQQSGAWCPYQVEKVVPCRVRNGTEPYYGANICWRNENGSYACTKKILGYRAKYATTYKKIMETKYKCCPGRDGTECENECFNCTTFKKLGDRLNTQERRISRLEKTLLHQQKSAAGDRFQYKDFTSQNSVYSPPETAAHSHQENRNPEGNNNAPASAPVPSSLAYATLNLRVQTILDEFREMQSRIRYLENEVSRLNTQVDDLSISGNIAYDYGTGSSNKDTKTNMNNNNNNNNNNNIVNNNNNQMASKDSPTSNFTTTLSSGMNIDGDSIPTSSERVRGDSSRVTGQRQQDDNDQHRHHHHHRHSHNRHQDTIPLETSTTASSYGHQHHHHHHDHPSLKSESIIRVLEENLERGDIASTLNDDYGDDLYNDNSTEQYIDQLHTKREQYAP